MAFLPQAILNHRKRTLQKAREACAKKGALLGKRFSLHREGQNPVDLILYAPNGSPAAKLPVLVNVHGGAWVGGDASQQDSFCQEIANRIPCFVINVNYTKVDVQPFPHPQQELVDTVLYFARHAEEYAINPDKIVLLGYSAGGHLCAGAAMLLKKAGFPLACQVLAYPFLDFSGPNESPSFWKNPLGWMLNELYFPNGLERNQPLLSPAAAPDSELKGLAPAIIITCGKDGLKDMGRKYAQRLEFAGNPVIFKEYEAAMHGFLEVNRPEYLKDPAKNAEQEKLARECKKELVQWLREVYRK